MQPLTLPREILHTQPQRNTRMFGKWEKTGKCQKRSILRLLEGRRQKSCAPGESFLQERGKWPCGSGYSTFLFFFPRVHFRAKRSFTFQVISFSENLKPSSHALSDSMPGKHYIVRRDCLTLRQRRVHTRICICKLCKISTGDERK